MIEFFVSELVEMGLCVLAFSWERVVDMNERRKLDLKEGWIQECTQEIVLSFLHLERI
jgi:hypothetical protein